MTEFLNKVPGWFWVVSVLALLWNLMGLAAFIMQISMGAEEMAKLPREQRALYAAIPSWASVAFGVAVFAGCLGSVGLLMKKNWATVAFVISLLGVLVQQFYMYFMSDTFKVMGSSAMAMPMMVLIAAIALILFAHRSSLKGWLRN